MWAKLWWLVSFIFFWLGLGGITGDIQGWRDAMNWLSTHIPGACDFAGNCGRWIFVALGLCFVFLASGAPARILQWHRNWQGLTPLLQSWQAKTVASLKMIAETVRKPFTLLGRSALSKKRMNLLDLRKEGVSLHHKVIKPEEFNPLPPYRSWHSDFNNWHTRILLAAGELDPELKAMLATLRDLPSYNLGVSANEEHRREQNMIWKICERIEKYLETHPL